MKLIFCPSCTEVRSLRPQIVFCECKKSSGKYIDNLNAVIYGQAIPLGFSNPSFVSAIKNQRDTSPGVTFTAFIIEKNCPTVSREV